MQRKAFQGKSGDGSPQDIINSEASPRKDIINVPTMIPDKNQLHRIFELGFVPSEDGTNDFQVSPEILQRNNETLNYWVEFWLRQSSMLAPFILEDFDVDRIDAIAMKDANVAEAWCEAPRKDSAIIVATGPSLEKYLEPMKSYKGVIIASATALPTLCANGIIPHYAVAVDANIDIGYILSDAPYADMGIKLFVPPTTDWLTASSFKTGSRFWFKSLILGANGVNHPFNAYMTYFYPWIENWIFQAGCVTNAMFLLLTLLNSRGKHNIEKAFLFGADFGYPEGMSRIKSYKYVSPEECADGRARWLEKPRDNLRWRTTHNIMTKAANGIITDESMLGYKRSLYSIMEMQGCSPFRTDPEDPSSPLAPRPCLYSCSEGILFEMPICNGKDVLESSGDCVSTYGEDVIQEMFENYMMTTGKAEGQIPMNLKIDGWEERRKVREASAEAEK